MTIAELYRRLEQHDWFHAMSDDHRVYSRGQEEWRRLQYAAAELGVPELFTEYSKHVFSGRAFGTPKHPKPAMPCPQCNDSGWYAYGETDKPEQRQCEACGRSEVAK